MDNFLIEIFNNLAGEVLATLIAMSIMGGWRWLGHEIPEQLGGDLPTGTATKAEFPFWLFTLIALLGVTLLCIRFFYPHPESGWRLAFTWLLYLLLSSGVLYVGHGLLMARKRKDLVYRIGPFSPSRRLLSEGVLAKAAIILLWTGVLLFTGPRLSLLVWSLGLGVFIDAYVFWEVLKLD